MITQVPELYDGGYWYRVPAVQDEDGAWTVEIPEFCADYDLDSETALVRTLNIASVDTQVSNNLPKFFARIGGR